MFLFNSFFTLGFGYLLLIQLMHILMNLSRGGPRLETIRLAFDVSNHFIFVFSLGFVQECFNYNLGPIR